MGQKTQEKKERNDKLVVRYLELKENQTENYIRVLEQEFDLSSSAIFAILKRRGVTKK